MLFRSVAEMFNVAPSLIRFWETEFDLIQPKKNRKGNRQFTKEDIENVRTNYHLVKEKGFTLQGAKEMIKNDSQSVRDKMDLLDSLKKTQPFIAKIENDEAANISLETLVKIAEALNSEIEITIRSKAA